MGKKTGVGSTKEANVHEVSDLFSEIGKFKETDGSISKDPPVTLSSKSPL
jgi:hypothetical protein